MLACIQLPVYVAGKVFAQVHVIRVGTQVFPVIWFYDNGTLFYFFEYACVGKDHAQI